MTPLLGYIPFLDPIPWFHDWSVLLVIPLAFGITVIYKAMRVQSLDRFWRHVIVMSAQIVISLILLAIGLAIVVQVVIPRLPS